MAGSMLPIGPRATGAGGWCPFDQDPESPVDCNEKCSLFFTDGTFSGCSLSAIAVSLARISNNIANISSDIRRKPGI